MSRINYAFSDDTLISSVFSGLESQDMLSLVLCSACFGCLDCHYVGHLGNCTLCIGQFLSLLLVFID